MYSMIELNHSVRASNDAACFVYNKSVGIIKENSNQFHNPQFIHEFEQLCLANLTFVDEWDRPSFFP